MRPQLQEPGRQGDCYLPVPGAGQCPTTVGSVVGSDPALPRGGRVLRWAEWGVQQVQKLELRSPTNGMAF